MSYNTFSNEAIEMMRRGLEESLKRDLESSIVKPLVEEYRTTLRASVREAVRRVSVDYLSLVYDNHNLKDEFRVAIKIDNEDV